jgi:hypothetical protein
MLVKFKQAVRLPPGPKGKDYYPGVHEVPAEAIQHPYFHKLIQHGLVSDGEASRTAEPSSFQDQQKKLFDRIASLQKKPSATPSQGQSAPSSGPVKAGPEAGSGSPVSDADAAQSLADSTAAELSKKLSPEDAAELKRLEEEEAAEKAEKAKGGDKHKNKQKR